MMLERLRRTAGFSLVELLIVIGIIGILAGTLIMSVVHYAKEARFVKTRSIISELETHLEQYEVEQRRYPPAGDLVNALEGPDRQGEPYFEFPADILGGPGVRYREVKIMDPGSGALSVLPLPETSFALDGFETVLIYVPSYQYDDPSMLFVAWNDENGNGVADIPGETYYQSATYQIWSAGDDGMVRGVRHPDGRLLPALMPRADNRDNDLDGLFDKDDTTKASSGRPVPQNLPEDDVMRGG